MQHLDVGEVYPTTATFWDENQQAVDPTTVTFTAVSPSGTSTAYVYGVAPEVTKQSTGHYHFDLPLIAAGVWQIVKAGAGVVDVHETELVAAGIGARSGPCEPWCTWEQVVRAAAPKDISSLDAGRQEEVVDFASFIGYGLTNGRYPGLCRSRFGVCAACRWRYGLWMSSFGGSWPGWSGWNGWSGGCYSGMCSCGPWETADLSDCGWPVWAVLDVTADGTDVPHGSWRVDARRWLTRTDGQTWPRSADLTDPDAFSATLVYGEPPPQGGDQAAATLAAEVAKGIVGGDCEIPAEVVQIVREGITYRTVDAKDLFKDGLTGVARFDRWLAAEEKSRVPGPGGFDPARTPGLQRLGTDRGLDQ